MKVRLLHKLAESIDGVDLSRHAAGDIIEMSDRDARMLIAEGWARPVDVRVPPRSRREAADRSRRPRKEA